MRIRGFVGAVAPLLLALALAPAAHAQNLTQNMGMPGQALFTYYETIEPFTICGESGANANGCNTGGNGDNIIRLLNPNGSANANLGTAPQVVCAMIYVFDDNQEMGECCGCPLTSAGLLSLSVEKNLTSNWALAGGFGGGAHSNGAIAIIAASPNTTALSPGGGGAAANGGCDPTRNPGYEVTMANNVFGSIIHNQIVAGNPNSDEVAKTTETKLFDDCNGNFANEVYLQTQCGALVGNGTGGGICTCPTAL
jgi:hypothetical protein